MEYNDWDLVPTCDTQHGGNGNLRICSEAVARNLDLVRRRWQRVTISPIPDDVGPLTFTDGAALHIPSDDDIAPDLP